MTCAGFERVCDATELYVGDLCCACYMRKRYRANPQRRATGGQVSRKTPPRRQVIIYILHYTPYERRYIQADEARKTLAERRTADTRAKRHIRGVRLWNLNDNMFLEAATS